LHAQPTQILSRSSITARGDLHQQATMMLEGRAADDLLARVRASLSASPSGLHDHETRLLDQPVPEDEREQLVEVDSSEIETPSSGDYELPAQSTRILGAGESMPMGAAPPPPPAARPRHDTAPDPAPRRFGDDDSKESTAPKDTDDDRPTNPRAITDHEE
jgi:hypothetical protein